jgi:hypothetical protein
VCLRASCSLKYSGSGAAAAGGGRSWSNGSGEHAIVAQLPDGCFAHDAAPRVHCAPYSPGPAYDPLEDTKHEPGSCDDTAPLRRWAAAAGRLGVSGASAGWRGAKAAAAQRQPYWGSDPAGRGRRLWWDHPDLATLRTDGHAVDHDADGCARVSGAHQTGKQTGCAPWLCSSLFGL